MISKNTIKYLQSLHQRKFRQKYNKFIAEGDKCCAEFLLNGRYNIDAIYATQDWDRAHVSPYHLPLIQIVGDREMKKISLLTNPTNVLIICEPEPTTINKRLNPEQSIIYLDGLQNPGNLGTIIRSADWYGVPQIVCSTDTVDYYHPKVVQAAMGSHNRITHMIADLDELKDLTSLPVIGTSLDGHLLDQDLVDKASILVIGNEGKGIRPECQLLLDHKVIIPGDDQRIAESLNAGVATSIMLDRLYGR